MTSIDGVKSEKSLEHLDFLARASATLGASLDYETTLKNVAKISVPAVADWCTVQLLQPDRSLKQAALAHENLEKALEARKFFDRYPIDAESQSLVAQVVRSGQAVLAEKIGPEDIRRATQSEEHFNFVIGLGYLSVIAAPIRARGNVLGAIVFVTTLESNRTFDLEDLRLLEDLGERAGLAIENAKLYREAQALNRVKDEFLATLSHELRSPLNVILGHAEILRKEALKMTPSELMSSIESIYRNAKAQTNLIGDLLDVSSIINGKVSYKPVELDCREVVTNIVEGHRATADAKGVKIILEISDPPHRVHADPTRLHQIIWNLVSNAVKFTPRGGDVFVSLNGRADEWRIQVSDTGSGIDPEFLPYVFDRFRQENASSTRNYGGLGLGLSIVRHLAELHGGRVEAESGGKGKGSKFTVILPPAGANISVLHGEKKIHKVYAEVELRAKKFLVIDDSFDNRILVKRILTRLGAEVVEAESAAEARILLQNFNPDLIVCDIGMPNENGIEFIKKLRASDSKPVPAIAVTAYVRPEEMDAALEAGFQAHVGKPVSTSLLLRRIQSLLMPKNV